MIRNARWLVALAAAIVVVMAAVLLLVMRGKPGPQLTAYFGNGLSLFPGTDVRVLGVAVGHVDQVKPMGPQVRVKMTLNYGTRIPAGAKAVVITPSLVSDRYVQLTPAYSGGAVLPRDAVLGMDRTATPLELDQLYTSLRTLSTDLGPGGKLNKNGALARLLDTGAANLSGNGQKLNDMVAEFGKAARTMAGSSDDLFATISNLDRFSKMLRANDGQVRLAENQLAQVSGFLAADREDLAGALRNLSIALPQVKAFIAGNRKLLKVNVDKLAKITQTLVNERDALGEVMDETPLALQNALNAYDPNSKTLMSRGNLLEIQYAYGKNAKAGAMSKPLCSTAAGASLGGLCSNSSAGTKDGPLLPLPPAGPVAHSRDSQ